MKTKFNQNFLDRLIKRNQRDRFLLLYPYLKNYILPVLRFNKFRETDSFDWDDLCSQIYCDIFILCSNDDWLNYHPNQVKRFLFVVSSNCMLRQLKIIYKGRDGLIIDDYENLLPGKSEKISIFDIIEIDGMAIERQLIRIYERILGKGKLSDDCKIIIRRYSRIIVERTIRE